MKKTHSVKKVKSTKTPPEPEPEFEELKPEDLGLGSIFRYKLSDPEFLFEEKCHPDTCIDPNETTHSVASVLQEVFSNLKLNEGQEGLRGAPHAFEPSGTSISPELKRQEFINYLRQTGFITGLAKMFLRLYEVPKLPADEDAVEFIVRLMGYGLTSKLEIEHAIAYKEKLQKQLTKYERERDILRRVLDNYQGSSIQTDWVNPANLPPLQLLEDEGEVNPYVKEEPIQIVDLLKPTSPVQRSFDVPVRDDQFGLGRIPSLQSSSLPDIQSRNESEGRKSTPKI